MSKMNEDGTFPRKRQPSCRRNTVRYKPCYCRLGQAMRAVNRLGLAKNTIIIAFEHKETI